MELHCLVLRIQSINSTINRLNLLASKVQCRPQLSPQQWSKPGLIKTAKLLVTKPFATNYSSPRVYKMSNQSSSSLLTPNDNFCKSRLPLMFSFHPEEQTHFKGIIIRGKYLNRKVYNRIICAPRTLSVQMSSARFRTRTIGLTYNISVYFGCKIYHLNSILVGSLFSYGKVLRGFDCLGIIFLNECVS